jgi:hypothetical protein
VIGGNMSLEEEIEKLLRPYKIIIQVEGHGENADVRSSIAKIHNGEKIIAQAIADRLEIDEQELKDVMNDSGYIGYKSDRSQYFNFNELADVIVSSDLISIKEEK